MITVCVHCQTVWYVRLRQTGLRQTVCTCTRLVFGVTSTSKLTSDSVTHCLPPLSHYTLSFLSVILFPRKHAFNKHLVVTAERCLTARDAVTLTSCVTCFYIFIVYLSLHVWPVMSWSVDPTQHSSVLFHLMRSQWLIAASLSNHHLNKCYRRFTRQWWCCRHTTET